MHRSFAVISLFRDRSRDVIDRDRRLADPGSGFDGVTDQFVVACIRTGQGKAACRHLDGIGSVSRFKVGSCAGGIDRDRIAGDDRAICEADSGDLCNFRAVIDFIRNRQTTEGDFLRRDVGGGRTLGRIGKDVVACIRAAQRQCAKGHRLARADILIAERTGRADRQVVTSDHAREGRAGGIDRSSCITIIDLITGGDTGNRDLLRRDVGCDGTLVAACREDIVACIRAAEGQSAEGHRLARADVLITERTSSADRQVVAGNHTGEGGSRSIDRGIGRAIVHLIACGNAADRDFLRRDGARCFRERCKIVVRRIRSGDFPGLADNLVRIGNVGVIVNKYSIEVHGIIGEDCIQGRAVHRYCAGSIVHLARGKINRCGEVKFVDRQGFHVRSVFSNEGDVVVGGGQRAERELVEIGCIRFQLVRSGEVGGIFNAHGTGHDRCSFAIDHASDRVGAGQDGAVIFAVGDGGIFRRNRQRSLVDRGGGFGLVPGRCQFIVGKGFAAQRQTADRHVLTRSGSSTFKSTGRRDRQLIIADNAAEDRIAVIQRGSGIAVIGLVRGGDAADGDLRLVDRGGGSLLGFCREDVVVFVRTGQGNRQVDRLIGSSIDIGKRTGNGKVEVIAGDISGEGRSGLIDRGCVIAIVGLISSSNSADGNFFCRDGSGGSGFITGEFVVAGSFTGQRPSQADRFTRTDILIHKRTGHGKRDFCIIHSHDSGLVKGHICTRSAVVLTVGSDNIADRDRCLVDIEFTSHIGQTVLAGHIITAGIRNCDGFNSCIIRSGIGCTGQRDRRDLVAIFQTFDRVFRCCLSCAVVSQCGGTDRDGRRLVGDGEGTRREGDIIVAAVVAVRDRVAIDLVGTDIITGFAAESDAVARKKFAGSHGVSQCRIRRIVNLAGVVRRDGDGCLADNNRDRSCGGSRIEGVVVFIGAIDRKVGESDILRAGIPGGGSTGGGERDCIRADQTIEGVAVQFNSRRAIVSTIGRRHGCNREGGFINGQRSCFERDLVVGSGGKRALPDRVRTSLQVAAGAVVCSVLNLKRAGEGIAAEENAVVGQRIILTVRGSNICRRDRDLLRGDVGGGGGFIAGEFVVFGSFAGQSPDEADRFICGGILIRKGSGHGERNFGFVTGNDTVLIEGHNCARFAVILTIRCSDVADGDRCLVDRQVRTRKSKRIVGGSSNITRRDRIGADIFASSTGQNTAYHIICGIAVDQTADRVSQGRVGFTVGLADCIRRDRQGRLVDRQVSSGEVKLIVGGRSKRTLRDGISSNVVAFRTAQCAGQHAGFGIAVDQTADLICQGRIGFAVGLADCIRRDRQGRLIDRQVGTGEDQIIVVGCCKRTLRDRVGADIFACIAAQFARQHAGFGFTVDQTGNLVSQGRIGCTISLADCIRRNRQTRLGNGQTEVGGRPVVVAACRRGFRTGGVIARIQEGLVKGNSDILLFAVQIRVVRLDRTALICARVGVGIRLFPRKRHFFCRDRGCGGEGIGSKFVVFLGCAGQFKGTGDFLIRTRVGIGKHTGQNTDRKIFAVDFTRKVNTADNDFSVCCSIVDLAVGGDAADRDLCLGNGQIEAGGSVLVVAVRRRGFRTGGVVACVPEGLVKGNGDILCLIIHIRVVRLDRVALIRARVGVGISLFPIKRHFFCRDLACGTDRNGSIRELIVAVRKAQTAEGGSGNFFHIRAVEGSGSEVDRQSAIRAESGNREGCGINGGIAIIGLFRDRSRNIADRDRCLTDVQVLRCIVELIVRHRFGSCRVVARILEGNAITETDNGVLRGSGHIRVGRRDALNIAVVGIGHTRAAPDEINFLRCDRSGGGEGVGGERVVGGIGAGQFKGTGDLFIHTRVGIGESTRGSDCKIIAFDFTFEVSAGGNDFSGFFAIVSLAVGGDAADGDRCLADHEVGGDGFIPCVPVGDFGINFAILRVGFHGVHSKDAVVGSGVHETGHTHIIGELIGELPGHIQIQGDIFTINIDRDFFPGFGQGQRFAVSGVERAVRAVAADRDGGETDQHDSLGGIINRVAAFGVHIEIAVPGSIGNRNAVEGSVADRSAGFGGGARCCRTHEREGGIAFGIDRLLQGSGRGGEGAVDRGRGQGLGAVFQRQVAVRSGEDRLFRAVVGHIAEVFGCCAESTCDFDRAAVGEGSGSEVAIGIQRGIGVDRGGIGSDSACSRCRSGGGDSQVAVGAGDDGLICRAFVDHIAQRTGAGVCRTGKGQRAVVGDRAAVKVAADIESAPMSVRFGDIGERITRADRGIFSIDRTRHIQGHTVADVQRICRDITGNREFGGVIHIIVFRVVILTSRDKRAVVVNVPDKAIIADKFSRIDRQIVVISGNDIRCGDNNFIKIDRDIIERRGAFPVIESSVSNISEAAAFRGCGEGICRTVAVLAVEEEISFVIQLIDLNTIENGKICIGSNGKIAGTRQVDLRFCLSVVWDIVRSIQPDFGIIIIGGITGNIKFSGNGKGHILRNLNFGIDAVCIIRITINSGSDRYRNTRSAFDGQTGVDRQIFGKIDGRNIGCKGDRIAGFRIRDRFAEGDFAVVGIHNILRGRNSQGFCFGSDGYIAGEGNAVVLVVGIGQGALRDLMGHVVEAQCAAESDLQRIAIGIRHGVSEAARIGNTLIGIRRNGNCLTIDRKCTVLRLDFVVAADLFRHGGSDRDSISTCIFTGCTIQRDCDGICTDQPHGSLISELFRIGIAIGLAGVVRLDGHRCLVDRERDFFRITGRRLDPVSSACGNVEDRAVIQRNESAFRSGIGFLQFPAEFFQRLIAGDHITGAVADGDDGIAEFRAVRECQIIDRGRDQIDTGGGFILGVVQDAHMEQFFRIGSVDDRHIFECNAADRRGGGSGSTGIRDSEGSEAGGIAPDRGIGGSKVLDDLGRRGAAHYLDTVFQRQFTVVPADHILGAGAIVDHIAQRAGGSVFRTGKDQRTVVGEGAAVEIAIHVQSRTGRKVCCCGSHIAGSDK